MKDWILEWILIGLFYCLIYIGWGFEIAKKCYYVLFRIPHIKLYDKFHPVYAKVSL
jgi:hypothetical protein